MSTLKRIIVIGSLVVLGGCRIGGIDQAAWWSIGNGSVLYIKEWVELPASDTYRGKPVSPTWNNSFLHPSDYIGSACRADARQRAADKVQLMQNGTLWRGLTPKIIEKGSNVTVVGVAPSGQPAFIIWSGYCTKVVCNPPYCSPQFTVEDTGVYDKGAMK